MSQRSLTESSFAFSQHEVECLFAIDILDREHL